MTKITHTYSLAYIDVSKNKSWFSEHSENHKLLLGCAFNDATHHLQRKELANIKIIQKNDLDDLAYLGVFGVFLVIPLVIVIPIIGKSIFNAVTTVKVNIQGEELLVKIENYKKILHTLDPNLNIRHLNRKELRQIDLSEKLEEYFKNKSTGSQEIINLKDYEIKAKNSISFLLAKININLKMIEALKQRDTSSLRRLIAQGGHPNSQSNEVIANPDSQQFCTTNRLLTPLSIAIEKKDTEFETWLRVNGPQLVENPLL